MWFMATVTRRWRSRCFATPASGHRAHVGAHANDAERVVVATKRS
jgi:hypothetical protein